MKASGISLQRSMRGSIIFVVILGIFTFFIANDLIPMSELKFRSMQQNMKEITPSAVIEQGIFTDIQGTQMNIKVAKKHGEDEFLEDVIIHEKNRSNENTTVIKAKRGELKSAEGANLIELVLYDGHLYQETTPKSTIEKKKHPFVRSYFKTYVKNMDISQTNKEKNLDKEIENLTDRMKDVNTLIKDSDSIKENNTSIAQAFSRNIMMRMGVVPPGVIKAKKKDKKVPKLIDKSLPKLDSLTKTQISSHFDSLSSSTRLKMIKSAQTRTKSIINSVEAKKKEMSTRYKIYNLHILSLHKKFALPFACIILFFIGAPLGAIIRKGGLGLPVVIGIVMFIAYHFLGVFAENMAKSNSLHPIASAWLPTMIMLPLGIIITKRATADRGLINMGNLWYSFTQLFKPKV